MSRDPSSITFLPTSVDPVKASLRTSGWVRMASPATDPGPVTTVKTPSGKPASNANSPRRMAVGGVCSAGLRTTVFPIASAGADFHEAMAIGKFHGTMIPQTPTGSRNVINTPLAAPGIVCPAILFVVPA